MEIGRSIVRYEIGRWVVGYGWVVTVGRCVGRWVVNMEICRSIVRYEIGRWVVGYGWVVTVGRCVSRWVV